MSSYIIYLGDFLMRTFYIFKIKKEITILTKEIPYNLYKTIENLYYYDNVNNEVSFKIFNDLFDQFDASYLNNHLQTLFKNNRFYQYDDSIHSISNKYIPENSKLKVYKSHLLLKSDVIKPTLLVNYLMSDNLFVCDFKNKDYFWLNEFVR